MDIFAFGISLKFKISSFQCEITNKPKHIGPLQKVNSLLHISKYLKSKFRSFLFQTSNLG